MASTINFSGLGSGIDTASLVEQLVQAERRPAELRINTTASKVNAQLSAFGTLKSTLSSAQSALEKLVGSADTPSFKASVPDKAGFTATVASGATAGKHEIEVLSLAKAHKLTSAAFAKDATVGTGKLEISAGENSYEIEFAEGATLEEIAAAINRAAGGKGVTASIINADDGQHLVLNATAAGTGGALKVVASGGDGGLAALAYDPDGAQAMGESVAATDAQVRVDGFLRTSSSNTISDLIPGVILNLAEAKANEKFALTISADNSALKANLASFVSMYNAAISVLRSTSSYNAETRTASALTGDSLVRSTQQQLRNLVGAHSVALADLGVTIAKDGTLSVDTAKAEAALADDPDALRKLLGKDGNLAKGLDAIFDGLLDSNKGSITQRTDSLNKRISDLSDQMDALDRRMEALEARYTAQFTAMDTLVAQLNSTSSYLASALAQLAGGNK